MSVKKSDNEVKISFQKIRNRYLTSRLKEDLNRLLAEVGFRDKRTRQNYIDSADYPSRLTSEAKNRLIKLINIVESKQRSVGIKAFVFFRIGGKHCGLSRDDELSANFYQECYQRVKIAEEQIEPASEIENVTFVYGSVDLIIEIYSPDNTQLLRTISILKDSLHKIASVSSETLIVANHNGIDQSMNM